MGLTTRQIAKLPKQNLSADYFLIHSMIFLEDMMKKARFIILVVVIALAAGQYALSLAANPPEPTYGSAVVDGDASEWDLTNDFFADMWEAGDPQKENAVVTAKLYMRYDCSSQTVYFLVLTEPGYILFTGTGYESLNWVKVYDLSNSPLIDGNGSPFEFVSDGDNLVGWEASAQLAPDLYNEIEVHAQIENGTVDGATSSTGKVEYRIPLSLICPTMDFGDLPASFGMTTLAEDGARHTLTEPNLTIGLDKDLELDGIPDGSALGDDTNNIADEEGVYPTAGSNWSDGQGDLTVVVDLDVPGEGFVGCLTGWLDFHDGLGGGPNFSFDEAGEYILQNIAVVLGENQLTFPLPVGVANDASFFGRFRLVPLTGDVDGNGFCTQNAIGYAGAANGGEVEDQVFVFGPTAVLLAGFNADSPGFNIQVVVLVLSIGIFSLVALTFASIAFFKMKA